MCITLSAGAKVCEAALKPVTSVASDVPCVPVLLPVPGSSRTSPLPHKRSVAWSAPFRSKRNTASWNPSPPSIPCTSSPLRCC
ncbi:hypothetical protein FFH21_026225 [Pseudomonas sp. KBS0707]|nr:hypothetical protein FFH21_026225 [Pseudomonas sp. KBS0707]